VETAQFVQSGTADVGILALSLALAPLMREAGRFWLVPLDAYPRMEQGGIIWLSGDQNQALTYHPSFLRSYYHVKESAHDDINADHENSRNRNH
jgi:hypothetical protein